MTTKFETEVRCPDCGKNLHDAGPGIGLYCVSDECHKKDQEWARVMVKRLDPKYELLSLLRRSKALLTVQFDSATLVDGNKLIQLLEEHDRHKKELVREIDRVLQKHKDYVE